MTAPTTTAPAIEVRGLRKSFGKQLVLDDIDLTVDAGTVFALLGPNGAGKTTAVHVLSTLIAPDAGEIRVGGHDILREPDAVRHLIGLTGQVSAVDGQFTGRENLSDGRPAAPGPRRWPASRRRPARALRPRRCGRQAGVDLVGRDAPPARPRDDARRRATDHLPR